MPPQYRRYEMAELMSSFVARLICTMQDQYCANQASSKSRRTERKIDERPINVELYLILIFVLHFCGVFIVVARAAVFWFFVYPLAH
jgi:hypothetical protein